MVTSQCVPLAVSPLQRLPTGSLPQNASISSSYCSCWLECFEGTTSDDVQTMNHVHELQKVALGETGLSRARARATTLQRKERGT